MAIVIIILVAAVVFLFIRIRRLEKTAITGTVKDETVMLHLNKKAFNKLKIKNE